MATDLTEFVKCTKIMNPSSTDINAVGAQKEDRRIGISKEQREKRDRFLL